MELRPLVSFDAVVRCGGFTRAAEHLRIAQPAISAQVRRLEEELGVRLLARTSRRVRLTEAGELFLVRVRRVLGELDAAREEAEGLAAVRHGRVVLGATPVLGTLDLPSALGSFAALHPGVRLTLRSGLVTALLDALDAGECDLVLGPVHDDLPAGYVARALVDDELVLVTPPGHRLARSPRGAFADLRDESFVCLPPESGLRRALDAAAAASGFVAVVPVEASTPDQVRAFVAAGLGVALLPASTARAEGPAVDVHEVHPVPRHPPFGLIHRGADQLSPAARALAAHLVGDGAATLPPGPRSSGDRAPLS